MLQQILYEDLLHNKEVYHKKNQKEHDFLKHHFKVRLKILFKAQKFWVNTVLGYKHAKQI